MKICQLTPGSKFRYAHDANPDRIMTLEDLHGGCALVSGRQWHRDESRWISDRGVVSLDAEVVLVEPIPTVSVRPPLDLAQAVQMELF